MKNFDLVLRIPATIEARSIDAAKVVLAAQAVLIESGSGENEMTGAYSIEIGTPRVSVVRGAKKPCSDKIG